jgi:hypothetical protein
LRFGAAGPGVDLEIAVVGVGLARQQALELASSRLGAQPLERSLSLSYDCGFALGLTQLDQLEGFVDLALDPSIAADRLVEPGTLAQQLLRRLRVVPQARVLGPRGQLGEPAGRGLPVKDASSAAPATS